jgi:16S rRNA (guanine527-N7)-methyltransferase
MNTNELLKILQNGCEKLHLHLSYEIQIKLIDYLFLLKKWNKTYNLTAIDDSKKIITHHILDSLAVTPYITGNNILDIGSGAGLPGIPLALALQQKHFILLDSNHKKTRFLFHVITTLKILNVEIVNQRVENYTPSIPDGFDIIITRAFSNLQEILNKTKQLHRYGCCLLAMKGKIPTQEIKEINQREINITNNEGNKQIIVYNLTVPGLNEKRHLVVIKNS